MIIDSGLVTGSLQVIGNTTMTGSLSVTGDITGNIKGNAVSATSASYAVSSSYATTASYALNAGGGGTPLYTHTQSVASNTWTVPHNLGTSFPIVTVYDNSSNVIIPQEITSTNTSSLSITFPLSIAGYASVAGGTFSSISQGTTQEQSIVNAIIFG